MGNTPYVVIVNEKSDELGRDFFRFLRVNYEIRQKSIVKIHKNMPKSQKLLDGRI